MSLFFLSLALLNGHFYGRNGDALDLIAAILAGVVAIGSAFLFSYVRIGPINEQINEDTCAEHGVFCCPECFDTDEPSRVSGTETEE